MKTTHHRGVYRLPLSQLVVLLDLPDGTHVEGASFDGGTRCLLIYVEHDSLPEITEGTRAFEVRKRTIWEDPNAIR